MEHNIKQEGIEVMEDRQLLITEIKEARTNLQAVNSQLYELTLQRVGWIDCIHGLEELFRRCQAEDMKLAKEEKEKSKSREKK